MYCPMRNWENDHWEDFITLSIKKYKTILDFMSNVRYRLGNNLATRLEELEKILNEPLPYNDYCYPISDGDAFFRRSVQYEHAIAGDSDVKLAECLWENLANSEVFEIEGTF